MLLATAVSVVVIDQATKAWALASLRGEPSIQVFGDWLQWTFATNPGAAFSLGRGSTWVFTLISAVAIGVILYFTPKVGNRWWAIALGLLLGGAVGNFIDRWLQPPYGGQGHVVDFIEVPNWPIFNIADMAVVVGALLMVVLSLREVEFQGPTERTDDPAAAVIE